MRSGFVAVVGRPNVGKSTLLNRIIGTRLAAVSPKAQTTWHALRGIHTESRGQMIFIDTPGLHRSAAPMNAGMIAQALAAADAADLTLVLVDGSALDERDKAVMAAVSRLRAPIVAVNKIDRLETQALAAAVAQVDAWGSDNTVAVSAADGQGVERLLEVLFARLPSSPPLYPDEELTDKPIRFLVAECVRQALFEQFTQELPYQAWVEIDQYREPEVGERRKTYVHATIHLARKSQKQIIIGSRGRAVRALGMRARELAEPMIGGPLFLELWVKISPKWVKEARRLREAGIVDPAARVSASRLAPWVGDS